MFETVFDETLQDITDGINLLLYRLYHQTVLKP